MNIEIAGISFSYQATDNILNDLNLVIDKGEFVGIVGPNGCGKTTLLKCLSKLLKPHAGIIEIGGTSLKNLNNRQLAQKLGVVPQKFSPTFGFTVEEIVKMGRFAHKGIDNQIVNEVMELTNIKSFADRLVTQLSGGELQRVIIAQALAQTPKVLLLDEATSNLDINHQLEIMELMKKLNKDKNLTIVAVMHDLNLAAQYCRNLIMLKEGKVFAAGNPEDVLTKDNIKKVYKVDVRIRRDPISQNLHITPYQTSSQAKNSTKQLAIHVIGGGGMAASILELLVSTGFQVSCGVINFYDSDWQMAHELEVPVVTELAFSPISERAHQENITKIDSADIVILANIPFGYGNLNNLIAVEYALKQGMSVVICDFQSAKERDFTDGQGEQIYNKLLNNGAVRLTSQSSLLPLLSKLEQFSLNSWGD